MTEIRRPKLGEEIVFYYDTKRKEQARAAIIVKVVGEITVNLFASAMSKNDPIHGYFDKVFHEEYDSEVIYSWGWPEDQS